MTALTGERQKGHGLRAAISMEQEGPRLTALPPPLHTNSCICLMDMEFHYRGHITYIISYPIHQYHQNTH